MPDRPKRIMSFDGGGDSSPALLGSAKLRKTLLVVMRNATTGERISLECTEHDATRLNGVLGDAIRNNVEREQKIFRVRRAERVGRFLEGAKSVRVKHGGVVATKDANVHGHETQNTGRSRD